MSSPFSFSSSTSRAILHLDSDAFFASCEQAINPAYRGKPVITGKERGIVSAASYEAKKFGIKRGVPLGDVKKLCPDAIILPSDYETYSLFSMRMFAIMRRFTPTVEEYSIDEAFADITGMRRLLHKSYPEIAREVKETVEKELGISVSIGLSLTKVLAKVASKWDKPSGCVFISKHAITEYLSKLPIGYVWGIGHQTANLLQQFGIKTADDFIKKPWDWVRKHMSKPYQEIWHELSGKSVYPIITEEKRSYKSISKTKTFTPPSKDSAYVFSQLTKNLENALIKARRYNLVAKKVTILLRKQDFTYAALEGTLNRHSCFPHEIAPLLNKKFVQIFKEDTLYRATGVILSDFQENTGVQLSLFEDPLKFTKMEKLYESVDELAKRYGKHTVFLGSSLAANKEPQHAKERGDVSERKKKGLGRKNERKFVGMPFVVSNVDLPTTKK